jgi:hypothetical protein
MRVLFISEDPDTCGGIPTYSYPIAQALAALNADVHYLFNGALSRHVSMNPMPRVVNRGSREDGVQLYELTNTWRPPANTAHPRWDLQGTLVNHAYRRWVEELRPEIVHIHSMAGFTADMLAASYAVGAKVVVTHHEYWWVCPRRLLVRPGMRQCKLPVDGATCAQCCAGERWWPFAAGSVLDSLFGNGAWEAVTNRLRGASHGTASLRPATPGQSVPAAGLRSQAAAHDQRRSGLLEALDRYVALNIAVSPVVAETLAIAGVDQSRITVRRIGSLAGTRIRRGPDRVQASPAVFVTLGGLSDTKGTRVVAGAFAELRDLPGWRARIYGSARAEYVADIASLLVGLPVEMRGGYAHAELPSILGQADWVVCAPTIEDTSPQTVLEAQAAGVPVLGARIGGVPFLVTHDRDGLLFPAGDAHALAGAMREVIADAGIRSRLSAGIQRPKSLREDAESLSETYAQLVSVP